MDAITIADQEHKTAMERGSAFLLNAMKLERGEFNARPVSKAFARKDFVWNARHASNQFMSMGGEYAHQREQRTGRVLAALAEKDRIAEQRRVNRDPCPLCAVRADIGCKHRRAA